ncbi:MAG: 3-phosphoshikimate 1-carboxyvinyltransferase [Armatimonadetes bacterium]|nr:3-phosphoshikimate 1-carboxyvinyltransferase [Armatimonadota bacterium]
MDDPLPICPVTRPIRACPTLPGSKSITNRALILAALADGPSTITGALLSDDTHHMARALSALGIGVTVDVEEAEITVDGANGALPESSAQLDIGNAGTAARFLTPMLALGSGRYRLDGDERMRQRPIEPLLHALRQIGADARSERGTGCPPLVVQASGLQGGHVVLDASASSQFLTGLLLSAPHARTAVSISVGSELASEPYIQMTIRMMADWGIDVHLPARHPVSERSAYHVPAPQHWPGRRYHVQPDASAASYFLAAAALTGGSVRIEHLGRASLQGDVRFAEVLGAMGCHIAWTPNSVALTAPTALCGVDVDMNGISDTVMTLAAIAPFADGPTRIRNVAHIRLKECDRLAAITTELRRLGVRCDEHPDGITIHSSRPSGAVVDTYNDHRIAMSFALIGLRVPGVAIRNPACVSKTFPGYFAELERVAHGPRWTVAGETPALPC